MKGGGRAHSISISTYGCGRNAHGLLGHPIEHLSDLYRGRRERERERER
jgi:hypothetical protein